VFLLAPPDGSYCHEGRGDGAFEETEEEADSGEAGEVLRGGETEADDAPDNSVCMINDQSSASA
jgi:hypothetical protein